MAGESAVSDRSQAELQLAACIPHEAHGTAGIGNASQIAAECRGRGCFFKLEREPPAEHAAACCSKHSQGRSRRRWRWEGHQGQAQLLVQQGVPASNRKKVVGASRYSHSQLELPVSTVATFVVTSVGQRKGPVQEGINAPRHADPDRAPMLHSCMAPPLGCTLFTQSSKEGMVQESGICLAQKDPPRI